MKHHLLLQQEQSNDGFGNSKEGKEKEKMGVQSKDLTPTIKSLWPHHRSMARTMVMGGLTPSQLAALYGFSPSHVTRIINSPMFRAEVARIEEDAEEVAHDVAVELKQLAQRAVEILDDQMNKQGVAEVVRQRAALEVLDRSGYGKKEGVKVPSGGLHVHNTQINIGEMSDSELRDSVMDAIEGEVVDG